MALAVPFPVGGALWPAPTALGGAASLCEPWRAARASSHGRPTAALWPCLTPPQGLRSALAGSACSARPPAPTPAPAPAPLSISAGLRGLGPGLEQVPGRSSSQNLRLLYLYSDVTVFCMRCWRSRRGCLPVRRGLTINARNAEAAARAARGAGSGSWVPVLVLSTSEAKGVGLSIGMQALAGLALRDRRAWASWEQMWAQALRERGACRDGRGLGPVVHPVRCVGTTGSVCLKFGAPSVSEVY